ncbi:Sodium-dependent phosphate transport protein 2B [Hondaea fermentalgiana]|uniref:Sodium-dependent phosphate transport protein 2B n=1 Tax=Hondaea fermentalgiana TaxID=2315210 RepID=A0A2R5GFF9_9STRA|nr:Sodium-dependent phosphate transport protein 2B [Hondaea fermentalgiana]|eukprot:GBG29652.1 Sodium-dependent phosphate transport protein 2B [Hondaea fermentalgiana]
MNGYLAILVGCGVTMFVQSSSITTSTLTPLVAMGTLTLEGMLPLTLGANLGTTLTGILASLVGDSANGFQLAMAHVLFNVFGVVMFYPIPKIRQIPIGAARRLGDLAALFKAFPIFYIFMLFLVSRQ